MIDHRARGLSVIRRRAGSPAETPAEAAARRAREYAAIMNPSDEAISEAAREFMAADRKAKGLVWDDGVPCDVHGRALDRDSTAFKMIAAQRKAEGKST
jgi:hypothetical protein